MNGISYIIGLVIAGVAAFFVFQDAKKRGMEPAALWAAGVFLFCIIVLPIYLITRKPLLVDPNGPNYPGGPGGPTLPGGPTV